MAHLIDTGYFALEKKADEIVPLIPAISSVEGLRRNEEPPFSCQSDVPFTPTVKTIQSRN